MTMEHIDIDKALADDIEIVEAVEARAKVAREIIKDVSDKEVIVEVAHAAKKKKLGEIKSGAAEELNQMNDVRRTILLPGTPDEADAPLAPPAVPVVPDGTAATSVFAPTGPANGLYTRSELDGMSNTRLQQIAGAYGMDLPVDYFERHPTILRILTAQRRWCTENNVDDPASVRATVRQPRATVLRDRVRSCWQAFALALLAAIVTLVVLSRNQETILGWAAGDEGWQDDGLVKFVFIVGPVVAAAWWSYILGEDRFCDHPTEDQ